MRECGDCKECCLWLQGDSFGFTFGAGTPCKFLECDGCGVHKARPESCRNYFCGWAQELFDEEYRPDKCGVLVSVEQNENGQYLRLTYTKQNINKDIVEYFRLWGERMNTPVIHLNNNCWEVL